MIGGRLVRLGGWRVELGENWRKGGVLGGSGVLRCRLGDERACEACAGYLRRSSPSLIWKDALCTPRSDDGPPSLKLWGI